MTVCDYNSTRMSMKMGIVQLRQSPQDSGRLVNALWVSDFSHLIG